MKKLAYQQPGKLSEALAKLNDLGTPAQQVTTVPLPQVGWSDGLVEDQVSVFAIFGETTVA
ncbi:hypothetical protein [Leisingera sp. F5]|uniref:hypothetical protein n=1 Tax=Leisingera sp. F5 TaxID=1813816 RepID=UPI000A633D5D|nr:hypothetical protein [Leisingera sp. F5]